MATANVGKEIDDQFLQCPICIDRFHHPKTLPKCGHTICENCLRGIVARSYGRLKCPICRVDNSNFLHRNDVSTLPDSFVLNSLIEYVEHKAKQEDEAYAGEPCGICSRSATAYCTVCDQLQCDDCRERHLKITVTKDHSIVSIEEYNSTPIKLLRPAICPIHNGNQVQMFCETCAVPVCIDCIVSSHHGDHHKHVTLKTATDQKRAKLVALTEQVHKRIPAFIATKDKLVKRLKERTADRTTLYNQVTSRTSSIIQELKENEQTLLRQIQDHFALEMDTLERNITHFEDLVEKADKEVAISNDLLWSELDALVFFMEKQHLSQLQDIVSQTTHIPLHSKPPLRFNSGKASGTPSELIGTLTINGKPATHTTQPSLSSIPCIDVQSTFKCMKVITKYGGPLNISKTLKEPRGLCMVDDEENFMVCAMGNDAILKYTRHGGFKSATPFEKPFDVVALKTRASMEGNLLVTNSDFLSRCNEDGDTYFCTDFGDKSHPLGITTSSDQSEIYCAVARATDTKLKDMAAMHLQGSSKGTSEPPAQTSLTYWDISAFSQRQNITFEGDCRFVAVNSRKQIIATDSRNGVVKVFSSETKQCLFAFGLQVKDRSRQLVYPLGVTTDPDDNIYVCSKGRVQMFSPQGKFLCRIDSDSDRLCRPFAICVTKRRPRKIIVTAEDEKGNGRIVIYKESG